MNADGIGRAGKRVELPLEAAVSPHPARIEDRRIEAAPGLNGRRQRPSRLPEVQDSRKAETEK